MPVPRFAAVSWCALALAVPLAPPAHALVPQQVLAYSGGYLPSEVTVLQGDTLTLTNIDPQQSHDIVSEDWAGSSRVFRSDVIGPGQQATVDGVESLAPSVYPFLCSVHEFMRGNITVVGTR